MFSPISGLLITYVALNLMDGHGQPALLYIVPFTICKYCLTLDGAANFVPCLVDRLLLLFTFFLTNYQISVGTFLALGMKRGELRNLWTRGQPERVCTHTHPSLKDSADPVGSS